MERMSIYQISSLARSLVGIGALGLFFALGLHFAFAQGQVPITPQFRVMASLAASPANYDGQCPANIKLTGSISMSAKGTVRYTFLRSDGMMSPIRDLVFEAPGTKPVGTTWVLGGIAVPSYSGWVKITILSPLRMETEKAEFEFVCR